MTVTDNQQYTVNERTTHHMERIVKILATDHPPLAEPSTWIDMPNEAYHADRSAASQSQVKKVEQSPAHFLEAFTSPQEENDTAALRIGAMLHLAVLEGPEFNRRVVVKPVFTGKNADGSESKNPSGTKEAKAKEAEWLLSLPGDSIIADADEYELAKAMALSVLSDKWAGPLVRGGEGVVIEKVAFFVDPETGIRCRCKPDAVRTKEQIVVELKSTADDARAEAFRSTIINMGYDHQGVSNLAGANAVTGLDFAHVWVVVEKVPPYAVKVHVMDETMKTLAMARRGRWLQQIRACIDANRWPAYEEEPTEIGYPDWFIKSNAVAP